MARATGATTHLHGGFETSYGTKQTELTVLSFNSNDLGAVQSLNSDTPLGYGRNTLSPTLGEMDVTGNIEAPIDTRGIGFWLKLLLGTPTTTDNGDGTFTHVFDSNAVTLPSMTLEKGFPTLSTPTFYVHTGVKADTMGINFERNGAASANFGLIAQNEETVTTQTDATPTAQPLEMFRNSRMTPSVNAAGLAILSGSINYSNNLDVVKTIRADQKIDGADEGVVTISGQLTMRFADTTFKTKAENGEALVDVGFKFETAGGMFLDIVCHEVYLSNPKVGISGPGGIDVTYDWQAALSDSAGKMMTITLKNDVAAY